MVRESAVLAKVNAALPSSASTLLQAFNNVVGTTFFPRYLEPFAPSGSSRWARSAAAAHRPRRRRREASVLKVRGNNDCGRGVEGTGFLYAPDRLMTNAHVVAGVDDPEVEIDGESVDADVVYYNPDLDVAVLDVTRRRQPPDAALRYQCAEPEDGVDILGYPQDGPYDVQVGRIRSEQRLRSPDIYGEGTVIREVFSLRGLVRPGNSGGPIVDIGG